MNRFLSSFCFGMAMFVALGVVLQTIRGMIKEDSVTLVCSFVAGALVFIGFLSWNE